MSIKPILFNTEMVRAILDGRKSCTRRIVKPKQFVGLLPDKCKNGAPEEFLKEKKLMFKPYCDMTDIELINTAYKAPYQIGDILYVRETFIQAAAHIFWYKADDNSWISEGLRWKPSIHMPKEAARIWLKVTDVRVERLQNITEDGCIAEGIYPSNCRGCNATFGCDVCPDEGYNEFDEFMEIWDSTIKKVELERYGWNANPYVWVIEFERCEKPKEKN